MANVKVGAKWYDAVEDTIKVNPCVEGRVINLAPDEEIDERCR